MHRSLSVRREVLFQYDLPVEILDEVGDEEVLSVLFGRTKDKFLIPLLFSDARIFWAYPETETVYKVFEAQYVDLVQVDAKFPTTGSASLALTTRTGKVVFPNIRDSIDDVRGAMLTVSSRMELRTGNRWPIQSRKNLLSEEYYLAENENDPILASDDDIFEDEAVVIRKPVVEEVEIFQFSGESEEEEVFEAVDEDEAASSMEHSSAVEERVARMIESTAPAAPEPAEVLDNDVIIYDSGAHLRNEQWHGEGGGDAEILPRRSPWKNVPKAPVLPEREVFSPEDDDSEVYVGGPRPKLIVPQPKVSAAPVNQDCEVEIIEKVTVLPNPSVKPRAKGSDEPVTTNHDTEIEVIEKVTVLPNPSVKPRAKSTSKPAVSAVPAESSPEPVMIFRRQKNPEAVTLQPKEGIDEATVDKSLEALRFLRDNKIISEAEYKKRSLSLFEDKE